MGLRITSGTAPLIVSNCLNIKSLVVGNITNIVGHTFSNILGGTVGDKSYWAHCTGHTSLRLWYGCQ